MESKMVRAQVYVCSDGEGIQWYEMFTNGHLRTFDTIDEVGAFARGTGGMLGRIVSAKESSTGQRYREVVYYAPPLPPEDPEVIQSLDQLEILEEATRIWSVAR